jgi:hypothetical protein
VNEIFGIVLLLVGIGMVMLARPAAGQDSAAFLRTWAVGQVYILVTLTLILAGVGRLLLGRVI